MRNIERYVRKNIDESVRVRVDFVGFVRFMITKGVDRLLTYLGEFESIAVVSNDTFVDIQGRNTYVVRCRLLRSDKGKRKVKRRVRSRS